MLPIHDSDNAIIYTNVTKCDLNNIIDHDPNDEIIYNNVADT